VLLGRGGRFKKGGNRGVARPGVAKALGVIAQLQTGLSALAGANNLSRTPAAATNTFDRSQIIAKTGSLLGDPKIPPPFWGDQPPAQSGTQVNETQVAQTQALEKVKEAESRVAGAQLNLQIVQSTISQLGNAEGAILLQEATAELAQEEERLLAAQEAYAVLIAGR
jgi:hypothetical protein